MRKIVVLSVLVFLALSLPYRDQLALVNSLQVGRDEEPIDWTCVGCDESNKPIHTEVIEDKVKEIRSILSVYEEYTVLAFRYTANAKNLWQDILWAFQVQDEHAPSGCKVQREYDNMWNTIRDDVLAGLRKSVHTGRLIITGISLGGGLAGISYVDIQKSGIFQNIEIVTFGAPRVGNKNWAAWFDTQTGSSRYFIKADPIAYLPRCLTFVCNYRQTGTPIVCVEASQTCTINGEESFPMLPQMKMIGGEIVEHASEISNGKVGGIVDHIYGYKKIRDYTLVN